MPSHSARLVATIAAVVLTTASCGFDEPADSSGPDAATTTSPIGTLPDSAPTDPAAYCTEFRSLDGERPEAYVGSPEHLADVERVLAVAPVAVADDLTIFRDFIASGAIDIDADPESTQTENFPAEVQSAISRILVFDSDNC